MLRSTSPSPRTRRQRRIHNHTSPLLLTSLLLLFYPSLLNAQDPLIIGNIDVNALVLSLSACSQGCLTSIPGFSLPITVPLLQAVCPRVSLAIAFMTGCVMSNACPNGDLAKVGDLRTVCRDFATLTFTTTRVPVPTGIPGEADTEILGEETAIPPEPTPTPTEPPSNPDPALMYLGINVTEAISGVSPCTQTCLNTIPEFKQPFTAPVAIVMCPTIEDISDRLTAFMVLPPRQLIPLAALVTAAATGALAHASHHSNGATPARSHAGVAFGPDLSKVAVREKFTPSVFDEEMPLARRADLGQNAVRIAVEYAEGKLRQGLRSAQSTQDHKLVVTDSYTSDHNGVTHVYLVQTIDGLEVVNGVANVNVDSRGNVISFSSTFYSGQTPSENRFTIQSLERRHKVDHGAHKMHGSKDQNDSDSDSSDDEEKKADSYLKWGKKMGKKMMKYLNGKGQHSHEHHHHSKHKHHHSAKKDESKADEIQNGPKLKIHRPRIKDPKIVASNDILPTSIKSPADALLSFANHLKLSVDSSKISITPTQNFQAGLPEFTVELPRPPISGLKATSTQNKEPLTVPAKLKYMQTSAQTLVPVWDLQVDLGTNWFHSHVDARTGEVLSIVDWVADASYNVFPLGTNDPTDGDRVMVVNPAIKVASPMGWHSNGKKNFTVTAGNNVYAHENFDGSSQWQDKYRPDGTEKLQFNFPVDLTKEPSEYLDAAVTNLFYWNNAIHDLFYIYGFNEKAGNFQDDNMDRGGKQGDAVLASAQDGSGFNNAYFATPPDGGRGRMHMFVWDVETPMRDGDLEGGIIMHEYAHGISTRLTGGPANSGCLGWGEAGGMGEGWGDWFATLLRMTPNNTRADNFGMGEYANGGKGIRKFIYSTSMETNPSTYSYISKPGYWGRVHAIGEVWAVILFEFYWNLVEKHGFNPNWYDTPGASVMTAKFGGDVDSKHYRDFRTGEIRPIEPIVDILKGDKKKKKKFKKGGNVLALQLVVDGLKLQPCSPNFVDARDAILLADEALTGGDNACEIWRGFAKRGLGVGAASGGREDFELPSSCEVEEGFKKKASNKKKEEVNVVDDPDEI
ncbi:Fungalysin/Thermolysin Extracellular metalloproteinase 5 [Chytridiales sp. JEL 0842]|nr:Fungalysin/Thermolysin Extracellular metalloproteinase 5 [Chytridiales sp. JEL 0842]